MPEICTLFQHPSFVNSDRSLLSDSSSLLLTAWYFLLSFRSFSLPFSCFVAVFFYLLSSSLPVCFLLLMIFSPSLFSSLLVRLFFFFFLFLLFLSCCHYYYNIMNQFKNCTLYTWTLSNNRKRTKEWANVKFFFSFFSFLSVSVSVVCSLILLFPLEVFLCLQKIPQRCSRVILHLSLHFFLLPLRFLRSGLTLPVIFGGYAFHYHF